MTAREVALLALSVAERQGAWANVTLKRELARAGLDRRDAALATRLTFGVLQNRLLLDFYLSHYTTGSYQKLEIRVRNALRLALYQMLFLTRVPVRAAINESVELTRRHSKNPRAPGMVNAILRNVDRHLDALPVLPKGDKVDYLSLRTSHPRWLVEELGRALGEEELERLLEHNNRPAPTTVQVNTCRAATSQVIAALEGEGVAVEPHPWLPDCLLLTETGDMESLTPFRQGLFYVQDPAARLAALVAAPQPGQRVLDCCAAPGGKAFAAAIQMENRGEITACDIHVRKRDLIESGAARLGLTAIQTMIADGTRFREAWEGSYDVVITDVPCSGLGVIRKKPDLRYRSQTEMETLPPLQRQILQNAARYLRPGGVLVYATCTLRREENDQVVADFAASHPDFTLEPFTLPGGLPGGEDGTATLWPHRTDTDGFFIAKLRRRL